MTLNHDSLAADSDIPLRRSIRLVEYDYSRTGAYFVTLVTKDRTPLLGEVVDCRMLLSDAGKVVFDRWLWLPTQYQHVELDEFVVMPNHLHGIIWLSGPLAGTGESRLAPTDFGKRKPLGQLVGAFKTMSAKLVNVTLGTPARPLWQRNFYDRIIRNEPELNRIREYIRNNPLQWELDEENPTRLRRGDS